MPAALYNIILNLVNLHLWFHCLCYAIDNIFSKIGKFQPPVKTFDFVNFLLLNPLFSRKVAIMLAAAPDKQIQIRLLTTEEEYKIEQNVFSLTSNSSNVELQDLLKNLLELSEESIEFNFRVGDEILQQTIGKYCEQTNLSGESILDVHYFKKRSISEDASVLEVDDWVGGVAISKNYIYAGLYNGQLVRWG